MRTGLSAAELRATACVAAAAYKAYSLGALGW